MINLIKTILILLILSYSFNGFSQNIEKYDKICDMRYYKSFYSTSIKGPSFVIYKLYKGGGDASRINLSFKQFTDLPYFNYTKSGYDRGHLVPAEDYAYTSNALKSTFFYVNCVPQTPKLNRGIWKSYENAIRKKSQTDSLLIICGGCDYDKVTLIPKKCFKIVYNLRNHRCLYALLFMNDNSGNVVSEEKLKKKISCSNALKLYKSK